MMAQSNSERSRLDDAARAGWLYYIAGHTQEEIAKRFGVSVQTVQRWRKNGWIHAVYYNDQKEYLYEPFFEGLPRHSQHQTQTAAASPMAQSLQEE